MRFFRTLRTLAVVALMCGAASMAARPADAGVDWDLRTGYYTDMEAFGLGAGLITPFGSGGRWWFNPNAEVAFGDGGNLMSLNGDVHFDFASTSSTHLWLGAGPALLMADPDGGDSETNIGLNVMTGIGGNRGSWRPFAQIKGVLSDNNEVVLQGGIRF